MAAVEVAVEVAERGVVGARAEEILLLGERGQGAVQLRLRELVLAEQREHRGVRLMLGGRGGHKKALRDKGLELPQGLAEV
ncbi:unnamed protein product [Phytomonas sp. Hart1]|nr:unnamed protein product [Phytomonas sp. Hart1]|eukprot:CCW70404.1 unnamed protein product [Phytomonas sp. isolate Hart1]